MTTWSKILTVLFLGTKGSNPAQVTDNGPILPAI